MNRYFTNTLRHLLDNYFPPVIRNNKFFMYPFFHLAFRGQNIDTAMNFKSLAPTMTTQDIKKLYQNLPSISRDRPTDLNSDSLQLITQTLSNYHGSLLDIGSGSDFFLNHIRPLNFTATHCDIATPTHSQFPFVTATIEHLPFANNSFDIVTCFHTLEHTLHPDLAAQELIRVAKKLLIIATPRQRYYYYTLDLHLQFFPQANHLTTLFPITKYHLQDIHHDWLYIGYLN